MREVWITGLGALSGAGEGLEPISAVLRAGASVAQCVGGSDEWSVPAAPTPRERDTRRLDRGGRLFATAADAAWQDAGLGETLLAPMRAGLFEGSSLGPLAEVADEARVTAPTRDARRASRLSRFMIGAGGTTFAQRHAIHGPVLHYSAGSISSACAIGEGFLQVAWGRIDLAIVGGGEAPLHDDVRATLRAAGLLGPSVGWPCRPFDIRRQGTMLGEGAGALVLESADHARRRGAEPLAVLAGYAMVADAGGFVAPDPGGAGVARGAGAALEMAASPGVAWIKAHGTGTKANDLSECRGLAEVLGADLPSSPITSIKPTIGHALGASGSLEAVAVVLALRAGVVPATVGTRIPDPELPPCAIATEPLPAARGDVLLLFESFGGRCAALVVRSP